MNAPVSGTGALGSWLMRVAVVTTSWPASESDAAGHFVRAETRPLEQGSDDVLVVAPPAGGAFGWPGVMARVRERPARAIDAALWVAEARARLRRLVVDRVIAHWAVPCAWPIGVAARSGTLEAVSHGGDVRLLVALPAASRRTIVGAIASRAERWRFVSEPLMEDLLRALDRETRARVERIAVIRPAALELPDVRDAVALLRGALGAQRVAVSVGRLVPSKRVDRAIEHVARSRDVDVLVVLGDGPERSRLDALARARGVNARFVGLVAHQEALAWIGAADVLLHASEAEGLSTVVREADALGTPVLFLSSEPPPSLRFTSSAVAACPAKREVFARIRRHAFRSTRGALGP
jgi:teichuronic acid biosynthesis glycosyltransferase TuaC